MNQDSLVKRLKGPSGSNVNGWNNKGTTKELVYFDIKRDKIPINSIDVAYMATENTGYINFQNFQKPVIKSSWKQLIAKKCRDERFDI